MGRAHALYTARDSLSLFLTSRPYLPVLGGFIVMIFQFYQKLSTIFVSRSVINYESIG